MALSNQMHPLNQQGVSLGIYFQFSVANDHTAPNSNQTWIFVNQKFSQKSTNHHDTKPALSKYHPVQ